MTEPCRRGFAETELSGYVDGELTQGDSQRVRLHLEDCPRCRQLVGDLQSIRAAAISTPFPVPTDEQWRERPRGPASRWVRRFGWWLTLAWLGGASWLVIRDFVIDSADWYEKALVASLAAGALLLFVSVLLDRLEARRTDRYRGVQK